MSRDQKIKVKDILETLTRKREEIADELSRYTQAEAREVQAFHQREAHDRAEESSARQEEENAAAVINHLTGELRTLDIAIGRLESGDIDCIACGEPIPLERLEAQPEALRCLPCQTKVEL